LPVPPNGARGAPSPRMPDSSRASGKQAAWTSPQRGLHGLRILRLMTAMMRPADSGLTATESMILGRDGAGDAIRRAGVSAVLASDKRQYPLCPGFSGVPFFPVFSAAPQ